MGGGTKLAAGSIRHRVEIQRRNEDARDAHGGISEAFAKIADRWARITPRSGRERDERADRTEAHVTHLITMRFVPGLTSKDRIVHAGRIFAIVRVLNLEERDAIHEVEVQEEDA